MRNEFKIADISLAPEGRRRMEWAWEYMPVLRLIAEKEAPAQPLAGVVVGTCLHLEAKTACLLKVLRQLGATVVTAGSNPLSTQDPVCAALVEEGVHVFSRRGMTTEEYSENLREMLKWDPQVIFVQDRYAAKVAPEITKGAAWAPIKAVKDRRVYVTPEYVKPWGHPCPESMALGELWMAKKLYPERFKDVDIDKIVQEFYMTFYGVPYKGKH